MKDFNTKIINAIIKHSSNRISTVNYLTETLAISKESAYRRIRNQIPFTIEEVIAIAKYFDLSIDQLLDLTSGSNPLISKYFNTELEPVDVYCDLLKGDIDIMEKLLASNNMKITATMNRIPFRFLPYKSLFKFEYFHYLYSIGKISLMTLFSDIKLPSQINNLHDKCVTYFSHMDNFICIVDSIAYSNIIQKIQYYHRLKFISTEDLRILQTELFELLAKYENLLHNGKNNTGSNYTFYYSLFNLESNIVFIEYDNDSLLQLWVYPESPIIIKNNPQINDIQKMWIESKIRNSVLITKTADIQQIEMLREIYRQISDLTKPEN